MADTITKLKAFTPETAQKLVTNIHKDVVNQSFEYDIDIENSKIGVKRKSETDYEYTKSLAGKSGASVTDIYEDENTNEIVFVLTDDAVVSAVSTETAPTTTETITSSYSEITLQPNVFYTMTNVGSLNVTLAAPSSSDTYNEYMLQFTTGSVQPVVTFDDSI